MDATVKLSDELRKQRRHHAVDENNKGKHSREHTKNLCDAFSTDQLESLHEKELPLENREAGSVRAFEFYNE